MEAIHDPSNRPWISSHVELNEYFQSFAEEVESSVKGPIPQTARSGRLQNLSRRKQMQLMGLHDESIMLDLEELMNPDSLKYVRL